MKPLEPAEPWTPNTVNDLYHALNTDRENIDVLVDVLAALEAFAAHLSEHERAANLVHDKAPT